ncbi:hypothetical protein Tco_0079806 [Tanacetum coccineum]
MDTGCRLFLVAGPLFLQFLGASFTHGTISSIPILGSISLEGFLPPILLLVVIMVTVVIIAVILVVVVVAIVGVVIVVAIIGVVVVVGGVSFIIKLSFVIIVRGQYLFVKSLLNSVQVILLARSIPIGWAYAFHQDKASSFRVPVANITLFSSAHMLRENTDSVRVPVGPVFLLGLLVPAIVAACASRAAETLSATSFLMAA